MSIGCLLCGDVEDVNVVVACKSCDLSLALCPECRDVVNDSVATGKEMVNKVQAFLLKHGTHAGIYYPSEQRT